MATSTSRDRDTEDVLDAKPWVIQFNGTSKPVLVGPFDGSSLHETDIPALQGKQCIGRDGDWSLMFDELTKDCFLLSLASRSTVPLPPLLDTPEPDLIFGCALSKKTPPDCTVMLGTVRETSLLYCRPNDKRWSRLAVQIHDEGDEFEGGILGYQGKMYATTMNAMVVVDMSCPTPVVERPNIKLPRVCPQHSAYKSYLVASCGDIFLVRSYLFGCPIEVVNLDIYRWNPSEDAWETVRSVGDRTFFLGRHSFAVHSATRTGTEPNCIHILRKVYDDIAFYTTSLDDMTIKLNILDGCEGAEEESAIFWTTPISSSELESLGVSDVSNEVKQRIEHQVEEEAHHRNMLPSTQVMQWSDLHTDLLGLLVPKLSFIDFLHLKAVCKHWRCSITSPINDAKSLPLLMTTRPGKKDFLEVFDPLSEKKYSTRIGVPESLTSADGTGSQILHFTKNGWVVLSRGNHLFFIVNPFSISPDDVIALPPVDSINFKGVSFSSVPGSPDFVVIIVEATPPGEVVTVKTWRIGDEDWKDCHFLDDTPFLMASHCPVFLEGEFYCLDINGRLGIFNPDKMDWTVLDETIRDDDELQHPCEFEYIYPVGWKGELVVILRENGAADGTIRMFKLDESGMAWSKFDGLKDAALFWGRKHAIARPHPGDDFCNKMFLPNYTETNGSRKQAFYYLEEQRYCPSFFAKEPMNAIWFEPNLDCFQL